MWVVHSDYPRLGRGYPPSLAAGVALDCAVCRPADGYSRR